MFEFEKNTSAFDFLFEKSLSANEVAIVKIPDVSPNKKSINDIGWQSDADEEIILYGTLSKEPESNDAIWQQIDSMHDINKTVSALKIVNSGSSEHRIVVRIIFN